MKQSIKVFFLSVMALFAVNFATIAQDTVATEEVATEVVAAETVEVETTGIAGVETIIAEEVEENIDLGETFVNFFESMGLTQMVEDPRYLIMIVIAC